MTTLTIAGIEREIAQRGLCLAWTSLCELEGKHQKKFTWRVHIQRRSEVLATATADDLNSAIRAAYQKLIARD